MSDAKPRRWRPRFSLLTLLLGALFVAACGGLWWRWEPWVCEYETEAHEYPVLAISFSPDGRRLVTGSGGQTARVWDTETGHEVVVLNGHRHAVITASFSSDGLRIVTGSADGTARIWDAESGLESQVLAGHSLWVVLAVFSPDDRQILTGSWDKTARVWDAETGQQRRCIHLEEHINDLQSIAVSRDRRCLATAGNDGKARVWDVATGQVSAVLEGHTGFIRSADFSRDGRYLVTAGWDKTARIWDADAQWASTLLIEQDRYLRLAVFSPDVQRIATVKITGDRSGSAHLWNAKTGEGLKAFEERVRTVAFSPDGRRLVTGGYDGIICLWSRRRPEYWWGLAWLPEFWIAYFSGGALLVIAARNLRRRFAKSADVLPVKPAVEPGHSAPEAMCARIPRNQTAEDTSNSVRDG